MAERRASHGWRQLQPFMPNRSRLKVAAVGSMSFLGGLAESLVLVLLTLIADGLIRQDNNVTLGGVELAARSAVYIALALVAVRVTMALANSVVSARFASQVMQQAQKSLLRAYLHSGHEIRSRQSGGDLSSVVVNHGRFTGDLASGFTSMAAAVCGLLAFGGTSLVVNPIATLGIAVMGLLVLGMVRPLRARSRASARSFAASALTLGREMTEIEGLHREIEVFRVGPQVLRRANREIRDSGRRYVRVRFYSSAIPQLFQAALLAAAVSSLLFIVGNVGEANLAAVGAVVLLLIRSMSSAQQFVTASQKVLEQTSYAEGVNDLIQTLREGTFERGEQRPEHLLPLRFDAVSFSYDGTTSVLNDLRLELGDGELVGIVGPSGAGKSTLVELLLGLRLPSSGQICCAGVPLVDVDPEEFAQRVAFVPQRSVLIAGTVAENVDLFRGLPEDRIRAAIKQAHLAEEIEALPDGINTRLGADQRALSGGQQQRLTIARALAGDPEVLILDEPTSALDAVSEHAIRQTLLELPAGRLVIVVAHRYSTLQSCSRILALRDGRLEADATPADVAASSEFFRTMMGSEQ